MTTVKLRFNTYGRCGPEWRDIEATVRGDLAVHRSAYIDPDTKELAFGKEWTVSHIPTGDSVKSACPLTWWRSGAFTARKRDLLAWADYHQRECADFYALLHDKPIADPQVRDMLREVVRVGQAFRVPA